MTVQSLAWLQDNAASQMDGRFNRTEPFSCPSAVPQNTQGLTLDPGCVLLAQCHVSEGSLGCGLLRPGHEGHTVRHLQAELVQALVLLRDKVVVQNLAVRLGLPLLSDGLAHSSHLIVHEDEILVRGELKLKKASRVILIFRLLQELEAAAAIAGHLASIATKVLGAFIHQPDFGLGTNLQVRVDVLEKGHFDLEEDGATDLLGIEDKPGINFDLLGAGRRRFTFSLALILSLALDMKFSSTAGGGGDRNLGSHRFHVLKLKTMLLLHNDIIKKNLASWKHVLADAERSFSETYFGPFCSRTHGNCVSGCSVLARAVASK